MYLAVDDDDAKEQANEKAAPEDQERCTRMRQASSARKLASEAHAGTCTRSATRYVANIEPLT